MFPDVPVLGLTATATSKITIDVQKMLCIQGCLVLKASFNRPNLYYEVWNVYFNEWENCNMLISDYRSCSHVTREWEYVGVKDLVFLSDVKYSDENTE